MFHETFEGRKLVLTLIIYKDEFKRELAEEVFCPNLPLFNKKLSYKKLNGAQVKEVMQVGVKKWWIKGRGLLLCEKLQI